MFWDVFVEDFRQLRAVHGTCGAEDYALNAGDRATDMDEVLSMSSLASLVYGPGRVEDGCDVEEGTRTSFGCLEYGVDIVKGASKESNFGML